MLKILFVGETWKGSSARSLRESLNKLPEVIIDEVGEDHYTPKYRSLILRIFNRILKPFQINDLARDINGKIIAMKPDVLLIYKGSAVRADFVIAAKAKGILTVNVFPDYSPHSYGKSLQKAMGEYDLVISTKPFHPDSWQTIYGYTNNCECIPHGYDPEVHYWSEPSQEQDFDVILAASWRAEYHELMLSLANLVGNLNLRIGVAGTGWQNQQSDFPKDWVFAGPLYGRAYGDWVRRGKIAIAPLHTRVIVAGVHQPGDVDTTRSYELAAANCFFLHKRTTYIQTVYDEKTEVPMWDNTEELAQLIREYIPLQSKRLEMTAKAHLRAVPAYSVPTRSQKVLELIQNQLKQRKNAENCA
jgi:hypothetical protein